jgi:hypothetical protein
MITKTFPLTSDQFTALHDKVKSSLGIDASNNGTESLRGFTVSWNYDGSTLTVSVTKKPFYIPDEAIESYMTSFVS